MNIISPNVESYCIRHNKVKYPLILLNIYTYSMYTNKQSSVRQDNRERIRQERLIVRNTISPSAPEYLTDSRLKAILEIRLSGTGLFWSPYIKLEGLRRSTL